MAFQFSSAFIDLRVWHLTKELLMTETFQLLQHPIASPRRCMVTGDPPPRGFPLGMAKPPTQKKAAYETLLFYKKIL